MSKKSFLISLAIITGSILVANLVLAWTTPSTDPPGGNLPAPINEGSDTQTKSGGLNISGNVGIGTTSPGAKLDVNGSIRSIDSSNNSISLDINTPNNAPELNLYSQGAKVGSFKVYNKDLYFINRATGTTDNIFFNTQSSENRMTITGNGNVGIGTTSPGAKLHVDGGNVKITSSGATVLDVEGGYRGELVLYDSGAGTDQKRKHIKSDGGKILFSKTNDAWNAETFQMAIDNNGNVGIGTTSPSQKLDVNGAVKATTYYGDGSNLTGINTGQWTDAGTYIYANNATNVAVTDDGSVGIGTTSPLEELDVAGYVKGDTNNLISSHSWTIGTGGVGRFSQNGSTSENSRVWGIGPHGQRAILWKAVGDTTSGSDGGWNSDYFPIDHTKTYRFTVWIKKSVTTDGTTYFGTSGGGASLLNLDGTSNSNPYFWSGDLPQLDRWYLLVGYVHGSGDSSTANYGGVYDGVTGQKVKSATDFKFSTSTTSTKHRSYLYYSTSGQATQYWWDPRVEMVTGQEPTIEALLGLYKGATQNANSYFGGNVGIGTTSPGAKLDVNGITYTDGLTNDGTFDQNGTADFSSTVSVHNTLNMNNANISGVGSLHIADPGDQEGIIWDGSAAKIFVSPLDSGNSDGYLRLINDGGIVLEPGAEDTEVVTLTSAGNVGIGTTSPGEKLEVNGNVQASAFYYSSDRRLKKNVHNIKKPLEKIMALDGVSFQWKKDNRKDIGLIAQDVEKIFPEIVKTDEQTGLKYIQYAQLVSPLIEAVKEQQSIINEQGKEIKKLKIQMSKLNQ